MAALRLALPAAVLAALALALPGAAAARSGCADAHDVPELGHLKADRAATLCLLNQERADRGLRPLRASKQLRRAARRHARDMVRNAYFDHVSLDGSIFAERIRRTGYLRGGGWHIGENIAWGVGELATPARTVRAWMGSSGHRRNILDRRFRQVGIGIVPGAPERLPGDPPAGTYTTDFGRRG